MRAVFALLVLLLAIGVTEAQAQQLVYRPINPAFGGNPINYSWLLSSATSQNEFQDDRLSAFDRDPFADFQSSLQRQILSQLSREIILDRFGDLDLSQPGTFNFGDFSIEVVPGLGDVSIRIFNLVTGDESIVTIPNLP